MPLETLNLSSASAMGKGAANGGSGGSSSGGGKSDFQPTVEELRTIQEKMKDPKFVELMHEYMQSLQDPETRREEEEYLEQAEREAREGGDFSFEFVFPKPGFVVELVNPTTRRITASEMRKVIGGAGAPASSSSSSSKGTDGGDVTDALTFINMCSSEKVEKHAEERVGNSRDSNWRVPVSVSAKRLEMLPTSTGGGSDNNSSSSSGADAKGNAARSVKQTEPVAAAEGEGKNAGKTGGRFCYVYDAVFNPTTLSLADHSDKFLCFLVEIAVEQINAGYGESNGFQFRRLPSALRSVGVPKNQTVRSKKGSGGGSLLEKAGSGSQQQQQQQQQNRELPVLTEPKKHCHPIPQAKRAAVATAAILAPTPLPPHTITHSGSIDMTDAWQWKVKEKRVGVPERLVVKLTFAGVSKASALDVDITEDGSGIVIAKTPLQDKYAGLLVLPFTVEPTPVKATLDKSSGTLTLVLTVVPPKPRAEDVAVAAEVKDRFIGSAIKPLAAATSAATATTVTTAEAEAEVEQTAEEENTKTRAEEGAQTPETAPAAPLTATKKEEGKREDTKTDEAAAVVDAAARAVAEKAVPVVAPPASPAEFTEDADRARLMMEKVMEARRARESAAAAAAAAVASGVSSADESAADAHAPLTSTATEKEAPAEADAVAASPSSSPDHMDRKENAESLIEAQPEEEIPFLQKRDAAREAEEAELRSRQEAWAAMVKEQMELKDAAEVAEAERLANVEKAKAAKKLAALKEAEALEGRVKAKMAATPLTNKYIFSID